MNILITGITGLFGSYLAREFSNIGEIHGLKRTDSSLDLLQDINFPIIWHDGDLLSIESLEQAVIGIDLVVHAAGIVSFNRMDSNILHQVNVTGTTNLINVLLESDTRKLVHISSVAAIGRTSEVKVIDENFKWVESPMNTDYGKSKYLGELEVWRGEQEGLEIIVVNPSILLGKVSDERSCTDIFQYVLKQNSFYPKGDLNYIDVRDAARQTRELVQKNAWGERFILNKEKISYKKFFELMASVFGKKAPDKPVTSFMLHLAVFFNSALRKIGLSKSPLNRKTAMISQQKLFFNNQKVNALLSSDYYSLEETFLRSKQTN
jgi:nucleoside-diphosphate-sugar epimerase